jgi:peptidoglycan/LPS O-acetylase OafA/YrhL
MQHTAAGKGAGMVRPKPLADHLPYLDGLRGAAAGWVYVAHLAVLNSIHYPVITWGGSAVDLFMMLSGFLMAFHYFLRSEKEPWEEPATWTSFWLRRFFRIAPLFYVLLLAAFLFGPAIGEWRNQIDLVFPSAGTEPARYYDQSPMNVLTHVTFLFGALPKYAFRTTLPDWSIGLEMQFYLVFPFLMLVLARLGPAIACGVFILIAGALIAIFPAYFGQFPMPSALALKLHVFASGMLVACALRCDKWHQSVQLLAIAVASPIFAFVLHVDDFGSAAIQIALVAAFAAVVFHRQLARIGIFSMPVRIVMGIFDSPPLRFLGDTSYGVYLVHLLIVIPAIGWLLSHEFYLQMPQSQRLALSAAVTVVPVYLSAWVLHRLVEKPGIAFGKAVLSRKSRKRARSLEEVPERGRSGV